MCWLPPPQSGEQERIQDYFTVSAKTVTVTEKRLEVF